MIAELADIQGNLREKWLIFLFALSIGLLGVAIAWRRKFFKSFQFNSYPIIQGIDVLNGFGYFLFVELLLIPSLIAIAFSLAGISLDEMIQLQPQVKGWMNLLIILGGFGGVSLAYLKLNPIQRQQLWHQTNTPWYRHIGIGVVAWFVSYPLVLAFSEGIGLILWYFFHQPFIEQIAVQNVRSVINDPLLFGCTAFSIVVLVPLTEEFLFRGLLQSWLKQKLHHTPFAIILSSCVFAFFHYSTEHGMTNIELIPSLFLFSCMLGYVYERQRSLWAPVGLHAFFNLISLLMISKSS